MPASGQDHDLFEALSRHLPEGTEKSHENLSQDSQYPNRDSNQELTGYKSEALLLEPVCSISLKQYFLNCIFMFFPISFSISQAAFP
jgi:hypothetical protein